MATTHVSPPVSTGDGNSYTAGDDRAQGNDDDAASGAASGAGAGAGAGAGSGVGAARASGPSEPHGSSASNTDNAALPALPSRRSTANRLSRSNTPQNAKDIQPKGHIKAASSVQHPNPGLDPLSTQIYARTNSDPNQLSIAQRILNPNPNRPESPNPETAESPAPAASPDPTKDRRKGPSFLSRLGMRGTWRRDDDGADSDSELGELRTDGSTNHRAFASAIGAGGGYVPLYKEPAKYVRVRPHNKKEKDFNRLFLAQELLGPEEEDSKPAQGRAPAVAVGSKILKDGNAIWAAEFSMDGRYLAVAGKDRTIRIFEVLASADDRRAHEDDKIQSGHYEENSERLNAPVFRGQPVREYQGHSGDILALSWSKNNFLLSTAMDKTVRLWHVSREDCLCTFKHSDLVTSVAFHPTDDRFFLAGSLDGQLRLWSIPDKSVAFSAPTNEFITAVAFSPMGKTAICGLLNGMCMFFETEGMKPQFQIHVRSSRGKNAKGSKITGIKTASFLPNSEDEDVKVLISSNDSRIRVYNLRTRMQEVKFKGLENQSSQIHARFSDDGKYVISGSEDRKAYIWELGHNEAELRDKQPYECFDAHPEVVTAALIAPTKTRQLLSGSGDPIFDLCNPPPVHLISLDERSTSNGFSDGEHHDGGLGKKPEESPAYIERSKHLDGNIIVTTDRTGTIKVFRQDCAFVKRQQNMWETASRFSGRFASVGRSGSVVTRTSGGSKSQSRRESLTLAQPGQSQDRIISWRQNIRTPTRSERSLSPMKSSRSPLNTSASNLAIEARKPSHGSSPRLRPQAPLASPAGSVRRSEGARRATSRVATKDDRDQGPALPPTPSFSLVSASDSDNQDDKPPQGGFWNMRWKGISSLRNSISLPPAAQANASQSAAKADKNGRDSLGANNKTLARKSIAVGETSRLSTGQSPAHDRRKSTGTALLREEARAERDEVDEATGKRRTDSGVGQLSTDSDEDEDHDKDDTGTVRRLPRGRT